MSLNQRDKDQLRASSVRLHRTISVQARHANRVPNRSGRVGWSSRAPTAVDAGGWTAIPAHAHCSLSPALVNQSEATTAWRTSVAKDAIVSQELADKFKTEKDSPYLRFVRGEGLDIISAQYVPNLRTVELKPWARKSGKGVFINHEASRTSNDCYVCEIAPGRKLEPQHHLFEEMILVLSGRGSTTVWNNAGARVTFEWKAGAIFAIRSIAGTSTSTARARSRCATSRSPMRRRSSTL
jgi:hypothetical protein